MIFGVGNDENKSSTSRLVVITSQKPKECHSYAILIPKNARFQPRQRNKLYFCAESR